MILLAAADDKAFGVREGGLKGDVKVLGILLHPSCHVIPKGYLMVGVSWGLWVAVRCRVRGGGSCNDCSRASGVEGFCG